MHFFDHIFSVLCFSYFFSSLCLDGALPTGSRFPLPALYLDQFRATVACLADEAADAARNARGAEDCHDSRSNHCSTGVADLLEKYSVSTVVCDGEADLELARACHAFKQHQEMSQQHPRDRPPRAFVLGNDSDFLVYRDCHYVNFRALYLVPGVPTRHALYAARVYHPVLLAEALGFPKGDAGLLRLCDLAVLLGNDYSADLTANAWDWASAAAGMSEYVGPLNVNKASVSTNGIVTESERLSSLKGRLFNALRNPSVLVKWLASQSDKWQLVGKTPHAARVLAYSRALYCDLDSNRAALIDAQARAASDLNAASDGSETASDSDSSDDGGDRSDGSENVSDSDSSDGGGDGAPPVLLPPELNRNTFKSQAVASPDAAAAPEAHDRAWAADAHAALARAGSDRCAAARELISLAIRALVAGGNHEWNADWTRVASAALDAAVSRAAASTASPSSTLAHSTAAPVEEDTVHERPEWRDVVAAYQLQVACARLLKIAAAIGAHPYNSDTPRVANGNASGKVKVWSGDTLGLEPRHFYHGPAFLNALSSHRRQIPPQLRVPQVKKGSHQLETSANLKLVSLLKQYSCESEAGQLVAGGIRTVEDLVLTSDSILAELGLKKGTRLKIGKWQREMTVVALKSVSQKRTASRVEEEEDDLSDSEDFLLEPTSASLHAFSPSGSLSPTEIGDSHDEELVLRTASLSLQNASNLQQSGGADQQDTMPKPSVQALGLSKQATQFLDRPAESTAQAAPVSSHSVGGSQSTRKNRPAWTLERWNKLDEEQKQIATTLPMLSSLDFEKYEGMSKNQLREECVSRGLSKVGVSLLDISDVLKTRLTIYERSCELTEINHNSRSFWTPEQWDKFDEEQKQIANTLPTLSKADLMKYGGMSWDQLRKECLCRGLRTKSVPKLHSLDVLKTRLFIYERSGKSAEDKSSSSALPSSTGNSLDITGEMAKLTFNGRVIIWNSQEWESLAPDDRQAVTILATSGREDLQKYEGTYIKELKSECKGLGLPVSMAHKLALRDILRARLLCYAKSNSSSKLNDSLPFTQIPENQVNNNNEVSRSTRKEFHTMSKAELVAECTRHDLPKGGNRGVLLARLTLSACATCGERGHTTPQCRHCHLPRPPHASPHKQRDVAARAPPPCPVVSDNNAASIDTRAHSWSVPGAGKLPIDEHAQRICNYVATHRVFETHGL